MKKLNELTKSEFVEQTKLLPRFNLIKTDALKGNLKRFLTGEPPFGKNNAGYEEFAYYYEGLGIVVQCMSVLIEEGSIANADINIELENMASDADLGLLALQYVEYYYDYYLKLECFGPYSWKPNIDGVIHAYNLSDFVYNDENRDHFSRGIADRLRFHGLEVKA